jgi:flavin reductase (DIM6/NTAB) family NADH-FMN oxidoreductase RutF
VEAHRQRLPAHRGLAYIDCSIEQVIESGDHYIVIGAVTDLDVRHEGGPLLFFRGGYGRFTV